MPMVGLFLLSAGCRGGLDYYGDEDDPPVENPDPIVEEAPGSPETTTSSTSSTTTPEPATPEPTAVPTTPTTVPVDTGTPPPPWTNGDPAVPPPYTELRPPPLVRTEDCVVIGLGTSVPDGSGEVVVESHEDNSEVKELESPLVGWYDLYDRALSDSGPAERNEIARIRVSNALFPDGFSSFANCGSDWVGPDPDNAAAVGTELYYLGTFWFEAGTNTFDLEHFCPTIRSGLCPELEDVSDPDSTCAADENNAIALVADGLCLVEPVP